MEPGGEPYDEGKFQEGQLRADLCEMFAMYDYRNASKLVDAFMKKYDIKRKRS